VNNKKVELYLCEQCARETGQMGIENNFSFNDLFPGLIGFGGFPGYVQSVQSKPLFCKDCGMSFEEFQKTGKLGCPNCYDVFSDKLKPLIKRLHGGIKHIGKKPSVHFESVPLESEKASSELDRLKDMLAKAIQNEEYEKAAELRDKIKELESKGQ